MSKEERTLQFCDQKYYFIKFENDIKIIFDEILKSKDGAHVGVNILKGNIYLKGDYFIPLKSADTFPLNCEELIKKLKTISCVLDVEVDANHNLTFRLKRDIVYKAVLEEVMSLPAQYGMFKRNKSVLVLTNQETLKSLDNLRNSLLAEHIVSILANNGCKVFHNDHKTYSGLRLPNCKRLVCSEKCTLVDICKDLKEKINTCDYKTDYDDDKVHIDAKKFIEDNYLLSTYGNSLSSIILFNENASQDLLKTCYIKHLIRDHVQYVPDVIIHISSQGQNRTTLKSGVLLSMLEGYESMHVYIFNQSVQYKGNTAQDANSVPFDSENFGDCGKNTMHDNLKSPTDNLVNLESATDNLLNLESATNNSLNPESATNNSLNPESVTGNLLNLKSATDNLVNLKSTTDSLLNLKSATNNSLNPESATDNSLNLESATHNSLNPESATDNLLNLKSTTGNLLNLKSTTNNSLNLESATDNLLNLESATDNLLNLESATDNLLNLKSTTNNSLNLESATDNLLNLESATNNSLNPGSATYNSLNLGSATNNLVTTVQGGNNFMLGSSVPCEGMCSTENKITNIHPQFKHRPVGCSAADEFIASHQLEIEKATAMKYDTYDAGSETWASRIRALSDAAVKFDILKQNHSSILNLRPPGGRDGEKNFGVFVQYNYARLSNLFRNFESKVADGTYLPLCPLEEVEFRLLQLEEEWHLFHYILSFPKLVDGILKTLTEESDKKGRIRLNKVCLMLQELCQCLSLYYGRIRILGGPQPHLQRAMNARLWMLKGIQQVFENSFRMLNIQSLDLM